MKIHHLGIGMTSQRTRGRLIERLRQEGIQNQQVLDVIYNTPRHIFVDEALASRAYEDTALPIGHGQTISQPYIVARMTEALLTGGPLARVLEVGTGCGYQAALLAQLGDQIYTIERVEALVSLARQHFQELGLRNIRIKHGDGKDGWPNYAPYDGIIVTAATTETPPALFEQLAFNGRLIIPLGTPGSQTLTLFTRREDCIEKLDLEQVSFVPLRGGVH